MGPRHHYSREGHLVSKRILGCNKGFTNIECRFQSIIVFFFIYLQVFRVCFLFVFCFVFLFNQIYILKE